MKNNHIFVKQMEISNYTIEELISELELESGIIFNFSL